MDEVELKQCSKCHEWLPKTDYYSNKGRHDGLHYYCKRCHNRVTNERNKRNREYLKQIREGEDADSDCRHCDKLEQCRCNIWRMDYWPKCFHGVTEADYYVTTVTERRYA